MKRTLYIMALTAVTSLLLSSCNIYHTGTYTPPSYSSVATTGTLGGRTSVTIQHGHESNNDYDLVPMGDIITYTIDTGTKEGKQKLEGLSIEEAIKLAETLALRKYKCSTFVGDTHATYLLSKDGKRILSVTIDGLPGKYRMKSN